MSPHPEVLFTPLHDGTAVLLSAERTCYTLNESGVRLWRWLAEGVCAADLPRRLEAEYGLDPERAQRSAETFTATLLRHGLVMEAAP